MSINELQKKLHPKTQLTLLQRTRKNKNGHYFWLTKCSCGAEKEIMQTHLINGNAKSCGCLVNIVGKNNPLYGGFEDVTGDYVSSLRGGAKRRSLEFSIGAEDIWNKYLKQNRKCQLTGRELVFGALQQKDLHLRPKQTASVDRIDSSIGYTKDNIQIVHSHVNLMKQNMSDSYFIKMCKQVAEHNNIKV